MDQDNIVGDGPLSVEKKRRGTEDKKAERKRQAEEREKMKLEPTIIHDFRKLRGQIKTFFDQISILSKKSPDSPMNAFKLKFLNDVLKRVTDILGEGFRPFPDFEVFDDAVLPTTSDVVLMLSHYMDSMRRFQDHHTYKAIGLEKKWHTKGREDIDV